MNITAIYFDMDGTIANLYNVPNWEAKLRNEDVTPYVEAAPLYDTDALNEVLSQLSAMGIRLGVVSHNAIGASKEYAQAVRKAKLEWCEKYCPLLTQEFHVVKYGTPKHYPQRFKWGTILVDDNADVRAKYNGATIDATKNILDILKKVVDNTFEV